MKKIFLLDDNESFIEITSHILSKEYEIGTAVSAENLAEKLQEFKPDLMIIDHFVGDENSGEIMGHLKTAIPGFNIPFIIFSASHDIHESAEKLQAAGYIEKPSSISYIKTYIKNFFEKRRS